MSKQVYRSGTSIGANIAESKNAQSKADFISKLTIALKEADETQYWLELLYDSDTISIEEFKSEKEPLWWVEFSEWEDPKTTDMFTKDNICLYLNPYYEGCPAPSMDASGGSIKNLDLLVDILAQTYLLIFNRLTDDDLRATKQNIGLTSNSICSILNQFIESCNETELDWGSSERLLKTLQINIRKMLTRGDE